MNSLVEESIVTPPPPILDMNFYLEDSVARLRQHINNLHIPVDTDHVKVGKYVVTPF